MNTLELQEKIYTKLLTLTESGNITWKSTSLRDCFKSISGPLPNIRIDNMTNNGTDLMYSIELYTKRTPGGFFHVQSSNSPALNALYCAVAEQVRIREKMEEEETLKKALSMLEE